MTRGIKDTLSTAVDNVVGSVETVDKTAEKKGTALLDRLGDKIFGPTAESENNNAPVIAPDASTMPVSTGRRSLRPDGQDPFRGDTAVPANLNKD